VLAVLAVLPRHPSVTQNTMVALAAAAQTEIQSRPLVREAAADRRQEFQRTEMRALVEIKHRVTDLRRQGRRAVLLRLAVVQAEIQAA
jgi:hypothetical protein